jgi:hypothetical protein
MLAWKTHWDAPESMTASNRFERGDPLTGKAILTGIVAA